MRVYLARIEQNLSPVLVTWFQKVSEGNLCPEYKTKQSDPFILAGALAPNCSVPLTASSEDGSQQFSYGR